MELLQGDVPAASAGVSDARAWRRQRTVDVVDDRQQLTRAG